MQWDSFGQTQFISPKASRKVSPKLWEEYGILYRFSKVLRSEDVAPRVMACWMAALGKTSSFRTGPCVRSPWSSSGWLAKSGMSCPEERGRFGAVEMGMWRQVRGPVQLGHRLPSNCPNGGFARHTALTLELHSALPFSFSSRFGFEEQFPTEISYFVGNPPGRAGAAGALGASASAPLLREIPHLDSCCQERHFFSRFNLSCPSVDESQIRDLNATPSRYIN